MSERFKGIIEGALSNFTEYDPADPNDPNAWHMTDEEIRGLCNLVAERVEEQMLDPVTVGHQIGQLAAECDQVLPSAADWGAHLQQCKALRTADTLRAEIERLTERLHALELDLQETKDRAHLYAVDARNVRKQRDDAREKATEWERLYWQKDFEKGEARIERNEAQQKYERECAGTWSRLERIRNLETEIVGWKHHTAEARWAAAILCDPELTPEQRRAICEEYPWMEEALTWKVMADVVNETGP